MTLLRNWGGPDCWSCSSVRGICRAVVTKSFGRSAHDVVEIKHHRNPHRHSRWHRDHRKEDGYGRNLAGHWRAQSNGQGIWDPWHRQVTRSISSRSPNPDPPNGVSLFGEAPRTWVSPTASQEEVCCPTPRQRSLLEQFQPVLRQPSPLAIWLLTHNAPHKFQGTIGLKKVGFLDPIALLVVELVGNNASRRRPYKLRSRLIPIGDAPRDWL